MAIKLGDKTPPRLRQTGARAQGHRTGRRFDHMTKSAEYNLHRENSGADMGKGGVRVDEADSSLDMARLAPSAPYCNPNCYCSNTAGVGWPCVPASLHSMRPFFLPDCGVLTVRLPGSWHSSFSCRSQRSPCSRARRARRQTPGGEQVGSGGQ